MKINVLIISLFVALWLGACGGQTEAELEAMAKQQSVVERNPVEVMVLQATDFRQQIVGNGKLQALRHSKQVFAQSGQLARVAVRNGQQVAAGTVLGQLDTEQAERNLADAELAFRKAALDRAELLLTQGLSADKPEALSAKQLDLANIRSGYSRAENDLARARAALAQHELRAPFAGKVALLAHKEHNPIAAGDVFCSLIDDSRFEVELQVLESDLSVLALGLPVRVQAFAGGEAQNGVVSEINPVVDANGMVRIKASVPNAGQWLEGMNVAVHIERSLPQQLVVPRSAVVIRQNKEVLFAVKSGRAYWTYVHTRYSNATHLAVVANTDRGATLLAGDTIIVDGNLNLAHESEVSLHLPAAPKATE